MLRLACFHHQSAVSALLLVQLERAVVDLQKTLPSPAPVPAREEYQSTDRLSPWHRHHYQYPMYRLVAHSPIQPKDEQPFPPSLQLVVQDITLELQTTLHSALER